LSYCGVTGYSRSEQDMLKTKLKPSHYTPWRRLGGRYSSYSFSTSALDGVSDQRHARAAL
jgi:hypothetical protein